MLTARDDEFDKVLGLELGADDYITKPFSIREFRAGCGRCWRSRDAAARDRPGRGDRRGGLRSTPHAGRSSCDGAPSQLTYVEFELLRTLVAQPGKVFSRRALESIWGDSAYREPRTIDVHVRHLREKLERDPSEPELILTVRGAGYRLRDREPAPEVGARLASRSCSSSRGLSRSST